MIHPLRLIGSYRLECVNPDGSIAWVDNIHNDITLEGLNDLLTVYFNAGSQTTTWYIGLINGTGFTSLSGSDTMASHPGWTEAAAYLSATRPTWTPTITGSLAGNTLAMTFTFTAGTNVRGLFLSSSSTKSGTTGKLFSTAQLSVPRVLLVNQTLRVFYNIRAAGGG